ncbi:TetR/AcrR family transcriptional regulator [Smaragdicoccus niigatensis]|uniref:TetR/AcrR family transcriptional regulator n=1 Tax=Smaragdicoccus niigatensis TaxID=359359 RepID=UPI00036F1D4D|nr:TetR/AcrR family transcriptional regulator [Smaragdicoccus niigatensis]
MAQADEREDAHRSGGTLNERRGLRRAAFMSAALDLIGEQGTAAVTMRALCRETGLADRYFYESFESRDELLVNLYVQVAKEVSDAIAKTAAKGDPAAFARALAETIVDFAFADPRKGRLFIVESLSDPALRAITLATIPTFTKLIRTTLPRTGRPSERAIVSIGLFGAIGAIFLAWQSGNFEATRDELVTDCERLTLRIMAVD